MFSLAPGRAKLGWFATNQVADLSESGIPGESAETSSTKVKRCRNLGSKANHRCAPDPRTQQRAKD